MISKVTLTQEEIAALRNILSDYVDANRDIHPGPKGPMVDTLLSLLFKGYIKIEHEPPDQYRVIKVRSGDNFGPS